jgi:hypothetical protein
MALGTHEVGVAADETHNNTLDRTAGSRSLAASGQRERYAAGTGERAEMIRDSSLCDVPRNSSDLSASPSSRSGQVHRFGYLLEVLGLGRS